MREGRQLGAADGEHDQLQCGHLCMHEATPAGADADSDLEAARDQFQIGHLSVREGWEMGPSGVAVHSTKGEQTVGSRVVEVPMSEVLGSDAGRDQLQIDHLSMREWRPVGAGVAFIPDCERDQFQLSHLGVPEMPAVGSGMFWGEGSGLAQGDA